MVRISNIFYPFCVVQVSDQFGCLMLVFELMTNFVGPNSSPIPISNFLGRHSLMAGLRIPIQFFGKSINPCFWGIFPCFFKAPFFSFTSFSFTSFVRGHQGSPGVTRGHQGSPGVTRGHQGETGGDQRRPGETGGDWESRHCLTLLGTAQ